MRFLFDEAYWKALVEAMNLYLYMADDLEIDAREDMCNPGCGTGMCGRECDGLSGNGSQGRERGTDSLP
jgi:hypothetical protein